MDNALGEPQTIVLLGGTSDIGRAIVERAASRRRRARSCSPAAGPARCAAGELARPGVTVDVGALRRRRHRRRTRRSSRDLVAAPRRPRRRRSSRSGSSSTRPSSTPTRPRRRRWSRSTTPARSASALAVAAQFRRQGHGRLVVLSSVAGERVRKANFVYGSSKAGLDGFAQGLGDALAGSGASVLVVRPGFVHSQMTEGMKAAPFATTPAAVAEATVKALAPRPADGLGAGHAAPGVQRLPPPARRGLAPAAAGS